jgi:hypothetical protein
LLNQNVIFLFVFLFSASQISLAGQVLENFTTTTFKDKAATTAIWNTVLGKIHPPLVVDYTTGGADVEDQVVDVGDGSDGDFNLSTFARFSVGGVTTNNIITLDTDLHPYFQFTNFILPSGWSIQGTGSNPLWFKVQGSFTNNGTIDCSGAAGSVITTDISHTSSGGAGRCGGSSGGSGGATGINATAGASGGAGVSGGLPSANTNGAGTMAAGGGGGGGYNVVSPAANGAGIGGGAAGISFSDDHILRFASVNGPGGGSGGGGGGAYLFVDANQSRGGGGGAGGGVIRVSVVGNFTNTGFILARGGAGGGATVGAGAGSGGAGSGGTIWIQTAGTYYDGGTIDSTHGAVGASMAPGTGTGGIGCIGRTWFTTSDGVYTGAGSENPSTNLADLGVIHYSKNAYVAQSLSYDLKNTYPTFLTAGAVTNLPSTSSAALLVAGSNDGFINDNSGFLPTGLITQLNGKRFIKFQMTIQLAGPPPAVNPATASSVSVQFNGIRQNNFPLTPTCGYIGSPGEFLFLISCFTLIFFLRNGGRAREWLLRRRNKLHLLSRQ